MLGSSSTGVRVLAKRRQAGNLVMGHQTPGMDSSQRQAGKPKGQLSRKAGTNWRQHGSGRVWVRAEMGLRSKSAVPSFLVVYDSQEEKESCFFILKVLPISALLKPTVLLGILK